MSNSKPIDATVLGWRYGAGIDDGGLGHWSRVEAVRSHVRPPPFDIATLQKRLRLVVIERDAEGKLLLACSAKFAVLAAKFERAKQGHIVFHIRKFGYSEDGAMATPIAMNAQYLGGQEYGVQAVMRHDGSLR
jgi:hypothetical protein